MKRLMKKQIVSVLTILSAFCTAFAGGVHRHKIVNFHKGYGEPIPFEKVPGTGPTMALAISGGKLYALEGDGLSVYDISDPVNPKRLGFVGGMGNVRQLKVSGNTAFLTSRQCGLWAVDVSDSRNPKILSNFDTVEFATGLDVVGNLAVVGNRVYGVQCVDVSDPSAMRHISRLRTDESQSVMYNGGLIFSGDWAGGEITVIDASDLENLKVVSKLALDGYGDGFEVRGNLLYASTGQHKKSGPEKLRHGAGHGLEIFDISDPRNPKRLSRVSFPSIYFGPCDYWTPRLSGKYCFASDTINGVFLLDVSNAASPKILGNLILPKRDPENPDKKLPFALLRDPKIPQGDPVSSIAVGDGVLYIAGTFTGLYVARMDGVAKPEMRRAGSLPSIPPPPSAGDCGGLITSGPELVNPIRAAAVDGDTVYAANVWGGLKIFRLSPGKMELLKVEKIPYVADVKRVGKRLFTAEGKNGIGVYDIVSPTELKEVGRLAELPSPVNFVQYVWAFEGCPVIVASCANSQIYFIDVSDPANPRFINKVFGPQILYGNYGSQKLACGKYFALNRHVGGNMIFDLSAPGTPKLVNSDTFPMCHQSGGVDAMGEKFITSRCGGYAFIDPENIVPTRSLKRFMFPSQERELADAPDESMRSRAEFPKNDFEGFVSYDPESKRLAVANRMYGVCRLYDFSDAANPKFLKKYELSSNPHVPVFWRGKLLIPGGYAGLLLEK